MIGTAQQSFKKVNLLQQVGLSSEDLSDFKGYKVSNLILDPKVCLKDNGNIRTEDLHYYCNGESAFI